MRLSTSRWLIIAAALLAFGCSSQKEPAQKAVAQIEASVAAVREEAAKFAPEELAGVDSALNTAKEKLAKGDYKGALADSGNLTTAVNSLKETVAEKKAMAEAAMAAANEQWNTLSADLPKMVAAIQSRVDVLNKSRKLPKDLSKESFDAAKSGLETMKTAWAQATSAFANGDPVNAVAMADGARQKGNEVLALLGMTPS